MEEKANSAELTAVLAYCYRAGRTDRYDRMDLVRDWFLGQHGIDLNDFDCGDARALQDLGGGAVGE